MQQFLRLVFVILGLAGMFVPADRLLGALPVAVEGDPLPTLAPVLERVHTICGEYSHANPGAYSQSAAGRSVLPAFFQCAGRAPRKGLSKPGFRRGG